MGEHPTYECATPERTLVLAVEPLIVLDLVGVLWGFLNAYLCECRGDDHICRDCIGVLWSYEVVDLALVPCSLLYLPTISVVPTSCVSLYRCDRAVTIYRYYDADVVGSPVVVEVKKNNIAFLSSAPRYVHFLLDCVIAHRRTIVCLDWNNVECVNHLFRPPIRQ